MIGDHIRPPRTELTPSQQVAAGERVQDLINHPGWADLLAEVREYDRLVDASMTFGGNSENEYNRRAGIRSGLQRFLDLAGEVIEKGKAQRAEEVTYD